LESFCRNGEPKTVVAEKGMEISVQMRIRVILKDKIEAMALEANDIPHTMVSYYDNAYDGLFQTQKGWGHVEAPEEHKRDILDMVQAVRAIPENPP
tara:strand:- start:113 stop:400 length:288 start_codon:yes stop_codon:yes gene_type:complete